MLRRNPACSCIAVKMRVILDPDIGTVEQGMSIWGERCLEEILCFLEAETGRGRRTSTWPGPAATKEAKTPDRVVYLPFGLGPRSCLGAQFALTEARILLARLAQAFRITLEEKEPILPVAAVTVRPQGVYRFRLEPRLGTSAPRRRRPREEPIVSLAPLHQRPWESGRRLQLGGSRWIHRVKHRPSFASGYGK